MKLRSNAGTMLDGRDIKRALDVAIASAGLVVLSPIFILIAIAVPLETRGPAIFVQRRVGRELQEFDCYKFRSMHIGTSSLPTHKVANSAITGVGKLIRATKLDELPQLINVLKGEMSLVGPRPCLPTQLELITERKIRNTLDTLPGITGLAQVRGLDMSIPTAVATADAEYASRQSLMFDIRVMVATFFGVQLVGLEDKS